MKGTLRSRRQFNEVYEKGLKAVGRHVVAFALSVSDVEEEAHPPSRDERGISVGIVASRKVGNAVARSRAKRVLRAALAGRRAYLPPHTRLVLVARRSIVDPDVRSDAIALELDELFARMGLEQGERG